jgi:hypothetical protein
MKYFLFIGLFILNLCTYTKCYSQKVYFGLEKSRLDDLIGGQIKAYNNSDSINGEFLQIKYFANYISNRGLGLQIGYRNYSRFDYDYTVDSFSNQYILDTFSFRFDYLELSFIKQFKIIQKEWFSASLNTKILAEKRISAKQTSTDITKDLNTNIWIQQYVGNDKQEEFEGTLGLVAGFNIDLSLSKRLILNLAYNHNLFVKLNRGTAIAAGTISYNPNTIWSGPSTSVYGEQKINQVNYYNFDSYVLGIGYRFLK